MRTPVIAGNWKMNVNRKEAAELVKQVKPVVKDIDNTEIVVCPPFTALEVVSKETEGTNIKLGAQNMHWEINGAYTGEISPLMLKDVGCEYVIIGHSERRHQFGESNESINKKIKSALENNITPIICVGETLEEREEGITDKVCSRQIDEGLNGLEDGDISQIVVAYEPVWAIGTGRTASAKDAEHVINFIRSVLSDKFGSKAAELIRLQYGGSVKPDNIEELMAQPNIDGALIGGASLKADSFIEIIKVVETL